MHLAAGWGWCQPPLYPPPIYHEFLLLGSLDIVDPLYSIRVMVEPPFQLPSSLPVPQPPILCSLDSIANHLVPPVHDCRPWEVFYVDSLSNLSIQTVWMWPCYFHTEVNIRPGVVMVNRMKFQDRLVCILCLLVVEMLHLSKMRSSQSRRSIDKRHHHILHELVNRSHFRASNQSINLLLDGKMDLTVAP